MTKTRAAISAVGVVLAFAAFADGAAATPAVLDLTSKYNPKVVPGETANLNVYVMSVVTSSGTVRCLDTHEVFGFNSTDTSNDAPTDRTKIGKPFGVAAGAEKCLEGLPSMGRPYIDFNTSHTAEGLVGELWMTAKGKATFYFRSGLKFEMDFSEVHEPCVYGLKTDKGTISEINAGKPLEFYFKPIKLKIDKEDSGIGCPKAATLEFTNALDPLDFYQTNPEYFNTAWEGTTIA